MTPTETLRQCRATLSLIDRADCKDDAVWQKVVDTQAEVDRVLRDGEPSAPTDISRQLRAQAKQPFGPEGFALLVKAADEIERYYGGMMAWKQTAETKDRKLSEEITARINERIEKRLAEQASPQLRDGEKQVEWTPGPNEFKDWCTQYFGPDADDTYLAEAVFNLPRMAQRFSNSLAPSYFGQALHLLGEVMRPYGIYDQAVHHAGGLQLEFIKVGKQMREIIAAHPAPSLPAVGAVPEVPPWAIAEFWSSANPGRKVRMLAEGEKEIDAWGKRGDFIRWIYPAAPQPAAAPSGDVVEALHELALLMSDTIRGEYEPDSFTLQPAVHALASVGIEFPDDDYMLKERESCVVVPVKPSAAMLKAMAESRAVDDEGEFPAMLDLLDFSGENKTRTALEAAYVAAITATKE